MQNEILHQHVRDYILGGKAHIVFHNSNTNNQLKIFVYAKYPESLKTGRTPQDILHWTVYDESTSKKQYLGLINRHNQFIMQKDFTEPSKKFSWIWKEIVRSTIPKEIHILHLGHCSICGKPLNDAISLERGIGPICFKNLYLTTFKRKP